MDADPVGGRVRLRDLSPVLAWRCCALRASGLLERIAAGYIALFQGTPLLMQLFVVYYGLALYGIKLEAWMAVAIGFTLHASAYLGEIWRGAIEAVPRGQVEAAKALSLGYFWRMKDVVLPQAFRISLPATIGFLVQLIKGTSLAAFVGFTELTRAGSMVSNQIFKPLLVFGIVGHHLFRHLLAAVALRHAAGAPVCRGRTMSGSAKIPSINQNHRRRTP